MKPARDSTNKVCCRLGNYCGEERDHNILHYNQKECIYSESDIICPYKYCKGEHEVKQI